MLKKIQFNLEVNKDRKVRNIEDLRNNPNIDDIYELFELGTLERWLHSRCDEHEYLSILNDIKQINTTESEKEIKKELGRILGFDYKELCITVDKNMDDRKRRNKYHEKYENDYNKFKENIGKTITEFKALYESLNYEDIKNDFDSTIDILSEIHDKWKDLIVISWHEVLIYLKANKCHLALLCLRKFSFFVNINKIETNMICNFLATYNSEWRGTFYRFLEININDKYKCMNSSKYIKSVTVIKSGEISIETDKNKEFIILIIEPEEKYCEVYGYGKTGRVIEGSVAKGITFVKRTGYEGKQYENKIYYMEVE